MLGVRQGKSVTACDRKRKAPPERGGPYTGPPMSALEPTPVSNPRIWALPPVANSSRGGSRGFTSERSLD